MKTVLSTDVTSNKIIDVHLASISILGHFVCQGNAFERV